MRLSKMLLGTMREAAQEAEIPSHVLMLRSGMIRKASAGSYNFMPIGQKVIKKVEKIIKEEMEKVGSQEILTTNISQEKSLIDAYGAVFAEIAKNEVKTYKQLPISLYQIQRHFAEDIRPRHGVMTTKDFLVKSCFSFDKDSDGLNNSYNIMRAAYINILNRLKLSYRIIESDLESVNEIYSEKFVVEGNFGEDDIMICSSCGYGIDIEKAPLVSEKSPEEEMKELIKIHTPNSKTIEDLESFFNTTSKRFAKTLIYTADEKIVAVMVRGDRGASESKIRNILGKVSRFEMADADTVKKVTNAEVGFAGPIGIKADILLVDYEVVNMSNFIAGANCTDYHYENVNYDRDFTGKIGDFRKAELGEQCPKCHEKFSESTKALEIAHSYKLYDKYSKFVDGKFIDEKGELKSHIIGSYNMGINRVVSSIIEQHHDENGIVWPLEVAPFQVVVIPVSVKDDAQLKAAEKIYSDLKSMGVDVLIDDRDERAGVKFKDSDLIGIPIRVTVGKKINEEKIEFKLRDSEIEVIEIEKVIEKVTEQLVKNNMNL